MATPEEGGTTASKTSTSYGGGGAGGKLRRKPPRRQTTPYDRPLTALRGNNIKSDGNGGWMTKLFVEPAYKLLLSGVDRLFPTVLRRRLPPPPPPQPPEADADVNDANQGAVLDGQDGSQEPEVGDRRQPLNSFNCNVVLELENLLKQKTFTRSEIVHLTELLQSRAVEGSLEDVSQKNEENSSEFIMRQEFASDPLKGNRNWGIRSSAVVTAPVQNLKAIEDDALPAELAIAYMGSRPSKVSPSGLVMHSKLLKEEQMLITNTPFTSKSPVMMLTNKASTSLSTAENGFVTPRALSRSAIYNMARTPYSRVRPTSILKGSGINNNGYAGPSTSSSLPLVANNEDFESLPLTLKRRSSVLDDEGASVGPMRRIRQKSNLSVPRFHHNAHGDGVVVGSHSKQKSELMMDLRDKSLKNILEKENDSVPSTSYARVPSKSREVAEKILQQLEKCSPKEKPSESKFVAAREKGPLKSTPSKFSGQVPRSREDVGSSNLLLDVQDDHKFGDRTNATLPDGHDYSPVKQVNAKENNPKAPIFSSGTWNSVLDSDSAITLKNSKLSSDTADFVHSGASQPPQNKRAFRISVQVDFLDQDDVQCNGVESRFLSEKKEPIGSFLMDTKLASDKEYKLVKPTIEFEDKLPLEIISSETNEFTHGAIALGEGTSAIPVPALEESRATSLSETFVSSSPTLDKPKESNNNPPLFCCSSKLADKFPPLTAECIERAETETRTSSSSENISVSIGSQVKAPEPDINGESDVSSAASNGPLSSTFSPVSFPTNQISTSSATLFTSSPSFSNFVSTGTSTSGSSSGSIFGLAMKPNVDVPAIKFGDSVDPSIAVSAASTTGIPEVAGQGTKVEINPSSGSSSSSHSTIASSSGSNIFVFGSSAGNNLQGSPFSNGSISGAGSLLQVSSNQLSSSTSDPAFNVNAIPSLSSSPSTTFGFNSSTSLSVPNSLAPVGGSSIFKFGTSATTVPEGSSASFTTSASGIFGFGLSSFSSSTTTVGSSSGGAPPTSSFGVTSSAPASEIGSSSSFSSGTFGNFSFGGSSSASSSSSSAPSSIFSSSWQCQKSPFGSTYTSPSPSTTGFVFGASSTSPASNAAPPIVFNASAAASSNTASPIVFNTSSPAFSMSNTQPMFGKSPMGGGFAASPGNNDQMNAEDSMAEDPVPSSVPAPSFGQPSASPSPSGIAFGSSIPQATPWMFSAQQNQAAPPNSSLFQATGSVEFNAGGGFSLGSGGADNKTGRKVVKINRNRNRRR